MAHKQQTAAISCRIRFARNLTGFPFPTRMNERQRRICEKVRGFLFRKLEYGPRLRLYRHGQSA